MRSAAIGAFLCDRPVELGQFVSASTMVTHTDPRALVGARAVAQIAAWAVRDCLTERPPLADFLGAVESAGDEDAEWKSLVKSMGHAYQEGMSVPEFAGSLGLGQGVSGYVYHTVPVVLYAWYVHFGDFRRTVEAVLDCGGDADTTGAIAGALAGAVVGEEGIPSEWVRRLWEWPRSTRVLRQIADRLAGCASGENVRGPVRYFWPAVLPRNVLFLGVVLAHGFRRLLPPY